MNPVLVAIAIPVFLAFGASAVAFARERNTLSFLQLLGAGLLVVVVLAHIAEACRLFPQMRWGSPHSIGHYVDLVSAISGLILFPVAFIIRKLTNARGPGRRGHA